MVMQPITKPREIARAVRAPGEVYVGMLIQNDVVYVVVQKASLLAWLALYSEQDSCGVYAKRDDVDAPLYLHAL